VTAAGPLRVLAVGAHPDDLEILCAGTLRRCVERGDSVVMCSVSAGDRGSTQHTREEIAAIRLDEARRSAALGGAEHVCLGFSDGEVSAADPGQRMAVIDLVREHRPDLILTHYPRDYMGDHNEVSRLVFDCSFHATLPLLESSRPFAPKVPALMYFDTLVGMGTTPTEYVDISAQIDTKRAMLETHASQVVWLREHDKVDIVADMVTVARFRGMQCGVAYAETFIAPDVWLRRSPLRLLP
jgi:N-acetylglucosamine malate deacetylase 1